MGKGKIYSAFPGTLPEQEIIVISFGIGLLGKEIVFLSIAGKNMGKGTSAVFSQPLLVQDCILCLFWNKRKETTLLVGYPTYQTMK